MNNDDPFEEWREVQDRRYDPGFYPGSGKINPFFRKLGAPDQRFGLGLLVVGCLLLVVGFISPGLRVGLVIVGAVLVFGGVGHLRADRGPRAR